MARLLVLGVTGMIGHKVFQVVTSNNAFDVCGVSKRSLDSETVLADLREFSDVAKLLKKTKPNFVINCSGLLIEDSEAKAIDAIRLNALLPLYLKELSDEYDFKLIQISTDCVFSGKNGPYKENAQKDATNVYGITKSLSEIDDDRNLTIRTSVIGPDLYNDGQELFHWFMCQEGEISGYKKSLWSGVTTLELAKSIIWSIDNDIKGLRNLTSSSPISKYELLKIMNEETNKHLTINIADGPDHNKSLINSYNFYYESKIDYKTIIKEMIDDIIKRKNDYSHYDLGF